MKNNFFGTNGKKNMSFTGYSISSKLEFLYE